MRPRLNRRFACPSVMCSTQQSNFQSLNANGQVP